MNNIPDIVLRRVEQEIIQYLKELNTTINWSDTNLKSESRKKTTHNLKKARRKLKNIKNAIVQRPSAALFGQSQVGKSYLIKTFLSDEKGRFDLTSPEGEKISFLEKINPEGGGIEATSVVCRFSTKVDSTIPEYPLVGKLLTAKEVILVLCDTYFNDVRNHSNLPNKDVVEEKIEQIKDFFGDSHFHQTYLDEDDVYEIKEYLEEHFKSFLGSILHSDYWDVLAKLIHKVDVKNWFLAFDIIFGKSKFIENIFNKLINELEVLKFSTTIFIEFKSVLRKHGTILNVARLREINDGPHYEDGLKEDFIGDVKVAIKQGTSIVKETVNKSLLCALLAEIAFKIDSKKEDDVAFLINSDLLDFPGANARLENNEADISEKHISDMILRGKVGYLFNKYSSQYLINNLLLCHFNKDLKAKSISALLNNWIVNFIGGSAEEREEFMKTVEVSPLFKIFTFFNADLAFDPVNAQNVSTYPTKWTRRFYTLFEKQVVNSASYDWHINWSLTDPYFNNNYLLRDFYHSDKIFTGFADNGSEADYVEINAVDDYYEKVKSSFTQSKIVQQYFKDPEFSWDEAATKNKDGSQLILANLTKVASNHSKTNKFIRDLNNVCTQVISNISKHFHSDDADAQIIKAKKEADELRLNLDILFGNDPIFFGRFIKNFTIKERAVYEFYREQLNSIDREKYGKMINEYIAIRNRCQFITGAMDDSQLYEQNMDILLKSYAHFSNKEEAEKYFADKGMNLMYLFYGDDSVNIKNNSQILADGLMEYWFDEYLNFDNFKNIIDLGFSETSLQQLFDNIKNSFKIHEINEKIADEIRDYVERIESIDEVIFMIADISAGIINKYFNSMGWDYYGEEEKNRLLSTNEVNGLNLKFDRLENPNSYASNEAITALFENMGTYNEELSKVVPNSEVINKYPNFWNFNRWSELMKISFVANCDIPTYDVAANRKLGEIIDTLNQYEFDLPNN